MSIISTNPTMIFQMPVNNVDLTATYGLISSPNEYFTITSAGVISGSDILKSLPVGSVDLVIPETIDKTSVTSIRDGGFSSQISLKSIIIPECITNISNAAFAGCGFMLSIKIPNGISSIGIDAFAYCKSLVSINIPSSVIQFAETVFRNCTSLVSINIKKAVNTISGAPWGAPIATVNWLG